MRRRRDVSIATVEKNGIWANQICYFVPTESDCQ
jgi:hypothetical protein